MPKGHFTPLTLDQEQIIKDKYLLVPVKSLADEIGSTYGVIMRRLKKWGLEIPKDVVIRNKNLSYYQKGSIPGNKGRKQSEYMSKEAIEKTRASRFQKGHEPHNTKYNGHERITKEGYIEIRIKKGEYRLKHLYNWEQINGKLPKNHCLSCVDGNKQNTDPNNWKIISRAENMYKNSIHAFPEEIIPSMVLINKITNKLNTLEDGTK